MKRMVSFLQKHILRKKVKRAFSRWAEKSENVCGIGIFGSLARGDFNKYSDIDVFVIVKEKKGYQTSLDWYRKINNLLKDFKRDVTVLVYPMRALKLISSWYVLRLAREGILLYDNANIKEIFRDIIKEAKRHRLIEEKIGRHKVWVAKNLRLGETLELKLE